MPTSLAGAYPLGGQEGGRRRGASVKTLKKMLKKAGLKTSGKKAALTRRAKKAHLKMRGGVSCADAPEDPNCTPAEGGRRRRRGGVLNPETGEDDGVAEGGRRRSRKSRGFRLY